MLPIVESWALRMLIVLVLVLAGVATGWVKRGGLDQLEADAAQLRQTQAVDAAAAAQQARNDAALAQRERDRAAALTALDAARKAIREARDAPTKGGTQNDASPACLDARLPDELCRVFAVPDACADSVPRP